jgi:hypothetical protein
MSSCTFSRSAAFWENLPGHTHLVFQTDSFLRNNTMERWLKYDYIGAPWGLPYIKRGDFLYKKVGNGGFSLRNKEAMLRYESFTRAGRSQCTVSCCHLYGLINITSMLNAKFSSRKTDCSNDFIGTTLYTNVF